MRAKPKAIEPDSVIEAYKKDVDRTLIRESLKRSPEERVRKLMEMQMVVAELQRAGQEAFGKIRPRSHGQRGGNYVGEAPENFESTGDPDS